MVLVCLPLSLVLIRQLLTSLHSSSDISPPFLGILAISRCVGCLCTLVVFAPRMEYCFSSCCRLPSRSSPPAPAHPQDVRLVSSHFCGDLSELVSLVHGTNIFLNPILVFVLALRTSIFLSVASFRLSPLLFIQVSENSGRPSHTVAADVFVAAFCNKIFFLQFRVVNPEPNPLAWRTGVHASSGPSSKDLSGLARPARGVRLMPA